MIHCESFRDMQQYAAFSPLIYTVMKRRWCLRHCVFLNSRILGFFSTLHACFLACIAHKSSVCAQDFAILDYRANMRLDNLPVAEIAKFAYDDQVCTYCAACILAEDACKCVEKTFSHNACCKLAIHICLVLLAPCTCIPFTNSQSREAPT